jgi:hypothetical protein
MDVMRRRVNSCLVPLLAAFTFLSGCGMGTPTDLPVAFTRPVTETQGGRVLSTVTVISGCQSGARLEARESDSTVTLTIHLLAHENQGEACPAMVGLRHISTTLAKPLGARSLIDGVTGQHLPAPESSTSPADG